MRIANDQNVRNRFDDAGNEGLRFLQRSILALEICLVAEQIGIDLIHLADDFDPRVLALVVQF